MAKNKVVVDVVVDDKGTTKKVGLQAKKTSKNLNSLSGSARTADRNLKGAAQASSNGTKNFSKMAQGVGGLVGVYATLAAQAFALSAAFEFLKKVGDLRVLKESQVAFASTTGIAIKSLSAEIRVAADGMLNFEEASKSAAIGLTSGLGSSQLLKLAEGAAAVSKVLGRDVSDSYDRLVRGVTKAEPELLDELGITLRLEDAKNKYAISIGKTVKELSLLEAKQAVAVEVQSQLDTKFISTTESIDIMGNAIKKFGVAFNDVFTKFAGLIEGPVETAATFFSENIRSLIAVIGLFTLTILKSMLPSLKSFEDRAVLSAGKAADAFDRTKASYLAMKKATSASGTVKGAVSNIQATPGSGISNLKTGGEVSKRQAAALLKYAKLEKGVYLQLTNYQRQVYKKALRDILGHKETFFQKAKRGWYKLGNSIEKEAIRAKMVWSSAMAMITKATTKATKAMNVAFKALLYYQVAVFIWDIVKAMASFIGMRVPPPRAIAEFAAAVEATRDSIKSLTTEYSKMAMAMQAHLEKTAEVNKKGILPTIQSYKTLGNAVHTSTKALADLVEQQQKAKELQDTGGWSNGTYVESTEFKEILIDSQKAAGELVGILQSTLGLKAFETITNSAEELNEYLKKIANNDLDNIDPKKLREIASEFELMSLSAAAFQESFTNSNLAFDKFVQGIASYKTAATDMLKTTRKEIEAHTAKFTFGGQILTQTADADKEREALVNRLAFLMLINDGETKAKKTQLTFDRKHRINVHGVTKLIKAQYDEQKKIDDLQIRYDDSLHKLASLEKEGVTISEEKKDILKQQTAALLEQIDIAKQASSDLYKLGMAAAQGFEDSFQTNLADLIKGKTSSFKDAIIGTMVDAGEALADELASQMTAKIMPGLLGLFGIKKKATPAELMSAAITKATEEAAKLWDETLTKAGKEYADRLADPATAKSPNDKIDTKGQNMNVSVEDVKDDKANIIAAQIKRDNHLIDIKEQVALVALGIGPNTGQTPDTAIYVTSTGVSVSRGVGSITLGKTGVELAATATATATSAAETVKAANSATEIAERAAVANAADKKSYLDDINKDTKQSNKIIFKNDEGWPLPMPYADPDKPIGSGVKKDKVTSANTNASKDGTFASTQLTGATQGASSTISDAFGEGGTFGTMTKDLTAGFGGMLARFAGSLGGGSTGGQILGMLASATISTVAGNLGSARNGGVFSAAGAVPGYATGGVAKGSTSGYPAMLHGTEAVVPLPRGGAIPVEMNGNGGTNNNIVVNISSDGQSNSQGSTGPDMDKLGGAVAKAVQVELQNQKRSGGILNPYGAA